MKPRGPIRRRPNSSRPYPLPRLRFHPLGRGNNQPHDPHIHIDMLEAQLVLIWSFSSQWEVPRLACHVSAAQLAARAPDIRHILSIGSKAS